MHVNKKIAGYCALAVVAAFALLILALPPILKHVAVNEIDKATGRKSEIAKISLNPFTLSAGISGLRLSEKGSNAPFLALSSARLSLSPLSLPKRSFIISELKLSSPYLHIVRNAPNDFNFTDLITDKTGKKEPKKGGTPLFSVNNITIDNGSVDFQDKALSVERDHRVRKMAISIPFVSNMPYLADRYVTPHFSAVINGSPFGFEGRLKPLTRAVEATIAVNVQRLDLPFYLGYLPVPLPVKVDSGQLTTAVEVGYRVDEKSGPEVRVSGSLSLDRGAIKELNGAPLASLERAQLKMKNLWLLSRRFEVSSLDLVGMEVFAARDRLGVWNFQKIGKGAQSGAARPEPQPAVKKEKPLDLRLAKFAFSGGKFHFSDALPKGGFKTDLSGIELSLNDFSLAPDHKAPFSVKLDSSRGEKLSVKGELSATPLDVKAALTLNGVPLKDYYPYLAASLTAPIIGTAELSSELIFNERQGLVLEKTALKGRDLAAPFGGGDGVRLKLVEVDGVAVDLKQRKATVERVNLKGANVALAHEKDGSLSALRLLRSKVEPSAAKETAPKPAASKVAVPKPAASKVAAPKAAAAKSATAKRRLAKKEAAPPPFSYRVGKITGSEIGIRFTDRTKEEEPLFTLDRLKFSLADISGPKQGAIPFTLATGYGNKGRIEAAGRLLPQPLKFKGSVQLQGIALNDFDAYLPDNLTVLIADGALDTKLALDVENGASGLKGSFGGSIGVRSFYCQDTVLDEDLLKWERLQIDQVSGTLGPFSLAVKDVVLSNFYSRIIVEKDGTLNVQHLMAEETAQTGQTGQAGQTPAGKTPPTPAAGSAAGSAPAAASAAAGGGAHESAAQPHPISIDTITMQGGTLAFSDRHLANPFDTTFFNLGGRVSGLSSKTDRLADVDLRGNLENHSPLSITGAINPLRGDLYLDMKVAFKDIELSPFTPYSNTYLGYGVDQGKLFLDLTYHIEKKTLSSQNKIFIDQFTFGKEAQSEKATRLPVRLAIALLKDRKGEIHLDLPVTGRTDDPQFSVWRVVLHILKNLMVKAATAPFALLGSMFGGNEDFSAVFFAPGSDQLTKPEQEKLQKLSKALHDRPALNLEISGFVDRNQDAEGYRNELLLKKMKGEKFRALAKQKKLREGQTQDETEILPEEYPAYLKAVYGKEKFSKPRNALGIAKELPDEEMKKLILTHTVVGDNELQALARERADAVKAFLQKSGGIPSERLFEKSADIYKPNAKEGSSGSRVEFGAKVK